MARAPLGTQNICTDCHWPWKKQPAEADHLITAVKFDGALCLWQTIKLPAMGMQ